MSLSPEASALNDRLRAGCPAALACLSRYGRGLVFPYGGTVGQGAEAEDARWNATIGIALDDDGVPLHLEAMQKHLALHPREVYPYAPAFGVRALREKWAAMQRSKAPSFPPVATLPVVTAGLTHGLRILAELFLDPGETFLIPDPCWDNYHLIFSASGATIVPVTMFASDAFNVDGWRTAMEKAGDKVVLLLNFPNNPTGFSLRRAEADALLAVITERAAAGQHVVVAVDDAYIGFTFEDDAVAESLFGRLAQLHERVLAVKIDGPTKEDCVWGHRVAFMTMGCPGLTEDAALALADKIAAAVRASVSNASHLAQRLLLHGYDDPQYAAQRRAAYDLLKSRYRVLRRCIDDPRYRRSFRPLPCNGGYFASLELVDGLDGEAVRKTLLAEFGVGIIAFGRLVRVAFSCVPERDIPTVIDAIDQACQRHLTS